MKSLLVGALVLALGDPSSGELPKWGEAQEPSAPRKPKVPSDGSGMITLGTLLLVSGGVFTTGSVAVAIEPELSPTGSPGLGGVAGGVQLGVGTVVLTLGLVVRRQFRDKPAIPGAPRTGNGMLLGGMGLMLGGTIFALQAIIDMSTALCDDQGCYDVRPIAAPVQLGCSLGSVLVGTGLLAAGIHRRVDYRRWDERRLQPTLQPTVSFAPGSLHLGVAGRF